MKTYFNLLTSIAAATLLSNIFSSQALAGDEKTISATGCTFIKGAGTAVRDERGRLRNTSTAGEVEVFCPLLRDNVTAKPTSVKVVVVDNSSTLVGPDNVTCKLNHMSSSANNLSVGATVGTTGTNSNGTILSLPIPSAQFNHGAYGVYCTIPRRGFGDPDSWIASITIDEP
jgi:hypothetical protein